MKIYTYEFLKNTDYIDCFCVRLYSDTTRWTRSLAENERVNAITEDAVKHFKVSTLGDRLFFDTDHERQKFLTWLALRWS